MRRFLWVSASVVITVAALVAIIAIFNRDPGANHQAAGIATPCETPASTSGMVTYHIIAPTTASYTVHENIVGVNPHNMVVGKTNAVQGLFLVQANGPPQEASVQLSIDLGTLHTDNADRDSSVQISLDVPSYPTAVFTSTCVRNLPAVYTDGKRITFHLIGNLTMNGKTNVEDFTLTGKLTGELVTGTAIATIFMTDFGISPPNFVGVDIVDNQTTVRLDFTAQPS